MRLSAVVVEFTVAFGAHSFSELEMKNHLG
jgi:hypothetical protein